ncbi:uncharacterized protein METZ01_LOCUS285978, partial [marine metagenome]
MEMESVTTPMMMMTAMGSVMPWTHSRWMPLSG